LHWEENARPGDIPPYETCPQLEYLRYKREFYQAGRRDGEPLPMEEWLKRTGPPTDGEE
jgi:hypothetical protein